MAHKNARLFLALSALVMQAPTARADGAFPDSLSVIAPAQRPHDILLATNFGLVSSVDDAQTWQWTCEEPKTAFGILYQVGAAPLNRLYAIATGKLVFSDDGACSWSIGAPSDPVVDAFPDPTSSQRMLAITLSVGTDAGTVFKVVESADAGATFGTVLYTSAPGETLSGVEIARSMPSTLYMTLTGGVPPVPKLGRSSDGGATWQIRDLRAALGADISSIRLVAIDPADPDRVFMRVGGPMGERLAVTDDGGATVRTPLVLMKGILTSFARLSSGTIVVGATLGVDQTAYRSTDGGQSFQALPKPPSMRGLSARGGTLYVSADNYNDGFAIGVSTDEGVSWQKLMRYQDIQAIQGCVKAQCQNDCIMRADLQWPAAVCDADAAPRFDAGTPAEPPTADAAGVDAVAPPSRDRPGGSCALASAAPTRASCSPFAEIAGGMWAVFAARRRRRVARASKS